MFSTIKSAIRAAALLFLLGAFPLAAHEGHDHGVPPPASAEMTPRAEADSKQFELVAVVRDGGLDIHLDSFLTNAPIADAIIAVDTPDGTVNATATQTETYRLVAPWSAKAGSYPLIFDIKAGGMPMCWRPR